MRHGTGNGDTAVTTRRQPDRSSPWLPQASRRRLPQGWTAIVRDDVRGSMTLPFKDLSRVATLELGGAAPAVFAVDAL
jgi:hypothetical protein